jgi:hypothetical protein
VNRMSKVITSSMVEKWVSKGRGKGHREEYIPWVTVRDVPSKGISTRIKGWKTGRVHHFLSTLELSYFYTLEWSSIITDIRERYPLPLEETLDIAERLNIHHPTDTKTKEPIVMTTDFLIDLDINQSTELKARSVLYKKNLSSNRAVEILEVERMFWYEKGIDWGIVTENEIPNNLSKNIEWIYSAKDMLDAPNLTSKMLYQIEPLLLEVINEGEAPFAQAALDVDERLGLKLGTSLWIVRHLLANRLWEVDMDIELDTNKSIEVIKAQQLSKREGLIS